MKFVLFYHTDIEKKNSKFQNEFTDKIKLKKWSNYSNYEVTEKRTSLIESKKKQIKLIRNLSLKAF